VQPSFAKKPQKLLGNALCIDFVNTVQWRGRPDAPEERLTSYGELLLWAEHAGALSAAEARRLGTEARKRPEDAAATLDEALALRTALGRLLSQTSGGELALVNALLARAPARTAIVARDGEYRWRSADADEPLEAPLWPVVWDAAALLTSDRRGWVSACGDPECGWLFLDLSRGRTRRWCSMEACGNRAKARRHYERVRAT
jgi:predicted RNA-binding Zn ribbon-like protein